MLLPLAVERGVCIITNMGASKDCDFFGIWIESFRLC